MNSPVTTPAAEAKAQLLDKFQHLEKLLQESTNGYVHGIRKQAIAAFEKLGFPGPKDEEWRYTNIASRIKGHIDFSLINKTSNLAPADLKKLLFEGLEANVMVFINGVYSPYASTILTPIHEVEILSFERAEDKNVGPFYDQFAKYAGFENDGLTALNTAFAEHGTYIYVPEGQQVALPVILLYISDTTHHSVFSQPRNLVVLGKNSHLKLIETYATVGESASFSNTVTEAVVAEGAHLEYYKFQNEGSQSSHVGTTQIYQHGGSKSSALTVTANGDMVRNNLNVVLDGEECEAFMHGLYIINGRTHVDNHTTVAHKQPNSQSNELYKGIIDGRSTAVFNGKILVDQIAQKTNAFQSNRNILLSDDATVNTKPQLEIFADDVRCTHGATTGALDEEPMFYLRSRGIGETEARHMLLQAFAGEVLDIISVPEIRTAIDRWLKL